MFSRRGADSPANPTYRVRTHDHRARIWRCFLRGGQLSGQPHLPRSDPPRPRTHLAMRLTTTSASIIYVRVTPLADADINMPKTHNLYVISLDDAILNVRRFRKKNPNHKRGKPCLYVGMTSRTPDERFKQHKDGYRAARYVKKYGKYLRRRLYEKYNPLTRAKAEKTEVTLANELRKKGYAVWQN